MANTLTPIDVWLKFDTESPSGSGFDLEDYATYEANTFKTELGYRIDWYHNDVGLVTSVEFNTLAEAYNWYEVEGFDNFTA